jgi:DNA-binding PadR family transcriptional regulator
MTQKQKRTTSMELRARYLVLLLLAEGPKTGYELIKRIRSLLSDTAGISPGTLYPLLHSLEEEGLVKAREEPHGQRKRKVYTLTAAGTEKLLEMIQRGLDIVEASFQLHIEAARHLLAEAQSPAVEEKIAEIAEKLRSLEEVIQRLRRTLEKAAGGKPDTKH